MTVYIEVAFLENFLLDGLLLWLALKCARAPVRALRLLFASIAGGAEAVAFPLLALPVWCAYLVKGLGGAALVILALPKGSLRTCLVALAAFFGLTFALGGLLTALYSFFGAEYSDGGTFLVERAPVALVLAAAGIFAVLVLIGAKRLYRYRKIKRGIFECRIEQAGKTVAWKGFADSGNCLLFRGQPVCVISAVAAIALFRGGEPVGRMRVSTVNGSRDSPVFRCARMTVGGDAFENVLFTVGEVASKEFQIILHTAFTEGRYENFNLIADVAEKVRGK